MHLRHFLDAAYAILVDEYQRLGTDLLTSIERVNESIGLVAKPELAVVEGVPSDADNDRALAELAKMMGGI